MDGKSSIIRILKAFALSAATTAVLFIILAAVCGIVDISSGAVRAVTFAISALSVLLWTFASARSIQRGGFVHGGAAGALYGACFAVLSVLYGGGEIAAAHIATMVLAVSAAGALGGVLGINSAK